MSPRWHAIYLGAGYGLPAAAVGYLLYLFSVPTWALCLVMLFLVLSGAPPLVWAHREWVLENARGGARPVVDPVARAAVWQLTAGGALLLASGYFYYFTGMQGAWVTGAASVLWQLYVVWRLRSRQPPVGPEVSTFRSPGIPTPHEREAIVRVGFYPTVCLFLGVAYCFLESYYLGVGFVGMGLVLLPRAVRKIRQILASARSEHER